jgi:hypothetical protein
MFLSWLFDYRCAFSESGEHEDVHETDDTRRFLRCVWCGRTTEGWRW